MIIAPPVAECNDACFHDFFRVSLGVEGKRRNSTTLRTGMTKCIEQKDLIRSTSNSCNESSVAPRAASFPLPTAVTLTNTDGTREVISSPSTISIPPARPKCLSIPAQTHKHTHGRRSRTPTETRNNRSKISLDNTPNSLCTRAGGKEHDHLRTSHPPISPRGHGVQLDSTVKVLSCEHPVLVASQTAN